MRALLIAALLCAPTAIGQTISVVGGASTEYNAPVIGATASAFFQNATDTVSFSNQGVSFLSEMPWHGEALGVGDQLLPASLPTDFNSTYGFFARGIRLQHKKGKSRWSVFAGADETRLGSSFSTVGVPQSAMSMLTYDYDLSPRVTLSSYNILSTRQSSIESLSWKASQNLRCAVSAGIGSNAPLLASLCNFKSRRWLVEAGYTFAGANFRPVDIQNTVQTFTTNTGANFSASFAPVNGEGVIVSHQNVLAPVSNGVAEHASIDSVNAYRDWLHASVSEGVSDATGVRSIGEDVGASTSLFSKRVQINGDFYHSSEGNLEVESVTERIARRLELSQYVSQYVTSESGKTSVSFGGAINSNFIRASVSYQTVFNPVTSGIPYQQEINVRISLALARRLSINLGTYTEPGGQTKYEVYENSYVDGPYRGGSGVTTHSVKGKYQIAGRVVDKDGATVEGAVLSVDGNLCITDSQGNFSLSVKRNRAAAVKVLADKFLSGSWTVVNAPATATPGSPISIEVERR